MKKKLLSLLSLTILFFLMSFILSSCSNTYTSNKTVKKIRLNEVVRSVFYAPMYVSINEGFFKEEGLDIELSIGQGADKTMQQVLSKSSDIGLCGPEQVIYIYNQKRDDYPVIFAQLTQKDGSFLVGKNKETNFKWESLKGKTVIGGRPGGVPEMAFEYVLRNHGLKPNDDVKIVTNIALTATVGAFKSGPYDYVTLFEPSGSLLQADKAGTIVASVGAASGTIPYTCFFSTKSYMDKNADTIEKFTKALYKGQVWVNKNSNMDVAKKIKNFFPGTNEDILASSVKNYKDINAFSTKPDLAEENLSRLMDIIQSYNSDLLHERPPFEKIVNNNFANKAVSDLNLVP